MTFNMTFGDAVASILLGVIGTALWVLLARAFPKVYEKLLVWWATRTLNASMRRIKKLESQRNQIARFRKDSSHYHATLIVDGNLITNYYVFMTASLVLMSTIVCVSWLLNISNEIKPDPSRVAGFTLRVIAWASFGAMALLHFIATFMRARLRRLKDLDKLSFEIEAELAFLRDRIR